MKKAKRIGIGFLCASLLAFPVPVVAAEPPAVSDNDVEPEVVVSFISQSQSYAKLSISGGSAVVKARAYGSSSKTTKTSVTAYLQKGHNGEWRTVKTWSKTTDSYVTTLQKTAGVSAGSYRVKAVIKAYQNGAWESKTIYSDPATQNNFVSIGAEPIWTVYIV